MNIDGTYTRPEIEWIRRARPDMNETIWSDFRPLKRLRRQIRSLFYCFPDKGWFGLTPLRTHIHICGYPRAGSTLLLRMMEYALPKARRFGREESGWRAAVHEWRNHALMISKVPWDILKLHRLLKFYEKRKATLRVIVLIRDPRDVITSHHASHERRYFLDIPTWMDIHAHVCLYQDNPHILFVRYENLVTDVEGTQSKIDAFTAEPSERPFRDFLKEKRPDFDERPLSGLRPVDTNIVGRWRKPKHRDRIEEILDQVSKFSQVLIDMGYEKDTSWIEEWRKEVNP
jgi:hypothetical protein